MTMTTTNKAQLIEIALKLNPDISRYTPKDMEAITGEEYPMQDYEMEDEDGRIRMVKNPHFLTDVARYEMEFKTHLRFMEAKAIQEFMEFNIKTT